jgi:hypothetical protein
MEPEGSFLCSGEPSISLNQRSSTEVVISGASKVGHPTPPRMVILCIFKNTVALTFPSGAYTLLYQHFTQTPDIYFQQITV